MIFTLVCDSKTIKSCFILEYICPKTAEEFHSFYKKENLEKIILFDSFEKAVLLLPSFLPNFKNNKIVHNVYWCGPNEFDSFVKEYIEEHNYFSSKNPFIFTEKRICTTYYEIFEPTVYRFEDEKQVVFFQYYVPGKMRPVRELPIYVLDKDIIEYFRSSYEPTFLVEDFEVDVNAALKSHQLFDDYYSFKKIKQLFEEMFAESWLFNFVALCSQLLAGIGDKENFLYWSHLLTTEKKLSEVKIYNVKKDNEVNLPFKKDDKGKEYLQYKYSSNSITGRIYATELEGYQALQTLPKEKRHLVEAESDCVLVEFDFKSFEIAILYQTLRKLDIYTPTVEETDPHVDICNTLKIPVDRDFGKKINYSVIYGMKKTSVAEMICEKFGGRTENYIPMLETFPLFISLETLKRKLYSDNFFKKICGDEIELFLINGKNRIIRIEKEYAILNNYIQSLGVDKLCQTLLFSLNCLTTLLLQYPKNKVLLQNHDSVLFQLEKSFVESLFFVNLYNGFNNQGIEFLVKSGPNWGSMTASDTTYLKK